MENKATGGRRYRVKKLFFKIRKIVTRKCGTRKVDDGGERGSIA